jgi:hypothetical protein
MIHNTLIEILIQCEMHCRICSQYCFAKEDNDIYHPILGLSRECADFCNVTMKLLIMDSPYAVKATAVCAEICNDFAKACISFPHHHFRKCAILCQETADQCDIFTLERSWTGNKFPLYIHYN